MPKEQILKLSSQVVYNSGVGATGMVEHDWSHATFGLSTGFALSENLTFTPGIYYQLSMEDSVNPEDESDLSFDWKRQGNSSSDDMKVAVSADAGQTWTTIFSVPEILNEDYHSESFDISDYITTDTQIRFLAKGGANGYVYFDNIKIDFGIDYEPLLWCADCDFNNDLIIDANDLSIFGLHWLE